MQSAVEIPTIIGVNATEKTPIHVLHVDDDPCILQVSKQILEMEGNFEVDAACSVGEAFKKLEAQSFNAIVCDFEMLGKTGLDFLAELRDGKDSIPFILFTGKGREEVENKSVELGSRSIPQQDRRPRSFVL
jgi:CheY-like chemotaxis protein